MRTVCFCRYFYSQWPPFKFHSRMWALEQETLRTELLWWVNLLYYDTGGIDVSPLRIRTALVSMNHQSNACGSFAEPLTISPNLTLHVNLVSVPRLSVYEYRQIPNNWFTFIQRTKVRGWALDFWHKSEGNLRCFKIRLYLLMALLNFIVLCTRWNFIEKQMQWSNEKGVKTKHRKRSLWAFVGSFVLRLFFSVLFVWLTKLASFISWSR